MIGQEERKEVGENGLGIDFTNDSFVREYRRLYFIYSVHYNVSLHHTCKGEDFYSTDF